MKNLKVFLNSVKGRVALVSTLATLGLGLTMTGCEVETPEGTIVIDENNLPNIPDVSVEPTTPVEPDAPVEPDEPVDTEKKYDYTVEGITNLYVDIYNDNRYLEQDEAWALVIAANMDNISEEDLNTLLDNKGFTLESLSTSYYNCIDKLTSIKINKHHSASFGGDVTYGIDEDKLKIYDEKRVKLDNLFIDEEYNKLCIELMEKQYYNLIYKEPQGELYNHLKNALSDDCNSSDAVLFCLDTAAYESDDLKNDIINPYDSLMEKQLTR